MITVCVATAVYRTFSLPPQCGRWPASAVLPAVPTQHPVELHLTLFLSTQGSLFKAWLRSWATLKPRHHGTLPRVMDLLDRRHLRSEAVSAKPYTLHISGLGFAVLWLVHRNKQRLLTCAVVQIQVLRLRKSVEQSCVAHNDRVSTGNVFSGLKQRVQ
jgi:hypothetical protein